MPALISIIAFFVSASSLGNKNNFILFSFLSCFKIKSFSSSFAKSIMSFSFFSSLTIFSNSFLFFSNKIYSLASLIISLNSEYSFDFSAKFFLSTSPEESSLSNSECLEIKF